MKILHAACLNSAKGHSGIVNQMAYETTAAKKLNISWDTLLCSTDREPKLSENPILRRAQFFFKLLTSSRKYDYILVRYLPYDPFLPFLALLLPNKVLPVFHWIYKKESYSLKQKTEETLLNLCLHASAGIVSVTKGIGQQICNSFKTQKRILQYINGIDLSETPKPSSASKCDQQIDIAFVASNFYTWHGLKELAESIPKKLDKEVKIHLVGELDEPTKNYISRRPYLRSIFRLHGIVSPNNLRTILHQCQIGIGTLAPQHSELKDACTLKTREYLANGLLAYNGLPDAAFPTSFPFFQNGAADILKILDFQEKHINNTKSEIRSASERYISKTVQTQNIYNQLKRLQCPKKEIL